MRKGIALRGRLDFGEEGGLWRIGDRARGMLRHDRTGISMMRVFGLLGWIGV
jgi:hypothetical protein